MKFVYTPELIDYIHKHNKKTLAVELVELNSSDLEMTDFHVYFVNKQMRAQLLKKGYRVIETDHGEVLLPRFPLQMTETVTFGLKSFLFFKHVTCNGIKV